MSDFATVEAQIRQLYADYADAVWRQDTEAFGACFTDDAEWRISGRVLAGRAQITAGIGAIFTDMKRVLMTFGTPLLTVSGEQEAEGRVYVTEHCAWHSRGPNINIGRYFDRYVPSGDRWRFSWRMFQLLYTGPPNLSGTFFDQPDFGAPPGMPPLDEVPPDLTRRAWAES
ncbi:hypothetical protein B2G71_14730 [Novosphingobium sp. PC22D]|uniref:nuclear transport factor 2 family protein n=1 Tax=Novosphingobium sp. PC22D TaxID=1962403 RepID=UPI000BF1FC6D|nr:nuclear transport factor 2 family protein [Novosphingobium sp. PC22D]PEQ12029.1 hypothetical protein B2G71_14730 [Novosphingobium sp. PC22D]